MASKFDKELAATLLDTKVDMVFESLDEMVEWTRQPDTDFEAVTELAEMFAGHPESAKVFILYLLDRLDEALTP